ncbi:hypothetical protein BTN49_0620 [Candidatus Enterovibrio escicola]|uniref:Uncharacterized protein n=1 Tax=Candidatus Enterovibrio escicola TaxID=1927127 RepID=A0A2A5T670_9GAMM|nr:hypothetical protein BTN49_0620 [Candidatus Enterovibrio escacola]
MVNLIAKFITYTFQPQNLALKLFSLKKPSLYGFEVSYFDSLTKIDINAHW